MKRTLSVALLTGALLSPGAMWASPQAASDDKAKDEHRMYDRDHKDYHEWNEREERAYRRWHEEHHRAYKAWDKADERERREYWRWRHAHDDRVLWPDRP